MIPTQTADDQIPFRHATLTDGPTQELVIAELACQALRASGYAQLRNLQVYFAHGRITLQGSLPTYYLKQVAQSVVLAVDGVRDIDNDVKVFS